MKRQKATYPDVGLDLNHDNRFMGYHGSRWLLWSVRVEYISVVLRLAFARLRFLEPVPCCILRLRFRRQDTHDIRNGNILVLLVFQENGWQGGRSFLLSLPPQAHIGNHSRGQSVKGDWRIDRGSCRRMTCGRGWGEGLLSSETAERHAGDAIE